MQNDDDDVLLFTETAAQGESAPLLVTRAVAELMEKRPSINPGDCQDENEVRALVVHLKEVFGSGNEAFRYMGWVAPKRLEGEGVIPWFARVLGHNQVHPLAVSYCLGRRYFIRKYTDELGNVKLVVMNRDAKNISMPNRDSAKNAADVKARLESGIAAVWLPMSHGGPWGHE